MAKAKKLPSGNWRVQVGYTDINGLKKRESFTASTKQQAEMMAMAFKNDIEHQRAGDYTVKEAVQNYIDSNEATLSPSTVYGYVKDSKKLKTIDNIRIRKLTSKDIQGLITALIDEGLSPKTIKNVYGLLRSSLTFAGIKQEFMVHLPSTVKKPKTAPENEQVLTLYENASKKMKIAIALAAFHSLRRGEIAALRYGDIKGNTLTIHADIIYGRDKKWHYKDSPKTAASYRTVFLSDSLLELIGTGHPEEFILNVQPNTIGQNFIKLKKKLGIDIAFHDLRHYFASLAVVLNVPDTYAASLGGWRQNSSVLKEVYQNNIVSMNELYAKKISDHFENLKASAHESAHE